MISPKKEKDLLTLSHNKDNGNWNIKKTRFNWKWDKNISFPSKKWAINNRTNNKGNANCKFKSLWIIKILRLKRDRNIQFAKRWKDDNRTFVRGQEIERISFLIINVVPLLDQTIIDEAWESLTELKKYQDEINNTNCKFD